MLDADDYPLSFIERDVMRLEFKRVSKRSGGLCADIFIKNTEAKGK